VVTAILVAFLALQSAPAQQPRDTRTWYQAYADAQRHVKEQRWTAAVFDIETALRQGAPKPGRRVRFYGNLYEDFNPDYYLGVAYLNLRRYNEAHRAFQRVTQAQLITPRDPLYAEFVRQTRMVSGMLDGEKQSGGQPPPPLPPARSMPPPPTPAQTPTNPSPTAGVPAFPWPPPRYSAYSAIAREWVAANAGATLASAAQRLEAAFDTAGYGERTYYWIPGGFALVSRIEQIQSDAAPAGSSARWAVNTPTMKAGFIDYVRALFNAPPGFYRVIVFTVTDQDFAAGTRAPTSNEARSWISAGSLRLPPTIGSLTYSTRHYTTALIYEFERRGGQSDARVRTPSDSPGRVHLEKAGLWQALARR
jgi:hypothetical protein